MDVRYNCNKVFLPPFDESNMFQLRPYCPCKSDIPEWLQGFLAGRCDDQMNYMPEGHLAMISCLISFWL